MAKKKKRNNKKSRVPVFSIELKGIFLIIMAVLGCCPFGIVSNIIKGFAIFVAGVWWAIFLVLLGVCGIYMIINSKLPDFFTTKTIGIYMMFISILVLSHTGYINVLADENWNIDLENFKIVQHGVIIVQETVNNMMYFLKEGYPLEGGGVIGAIFASIFCGLLTLNGARIVAIALIIFGFIMYTGKSFFDVLGKIKDFIVRIGSRVKDKRKNKANKKATDDQVVISSVDELKQDDPEDNAVEESIEVVDSEVKEYQFPPITLLNRPSKTSSKDNNELIKKSIPILTQVLADFGIESKVVAAHVGPAVTQYELEIKAGTKVNKILGLNREIALALAAKDVRIQAPIPGKKTIGIELPNAKVSPVCVREVLASIPSKLSSSKLITVLGRDIMGEPQWMEINKTPHLLVAGSTGSGKSVCINSMLASILMRAKPDEVKLVLVDPKKVELSIYNGIPHLLTPVVTNPKKANIVLQKIVAEMERRYDVFEDSKTKNITSYNKYIDKKNEKLNDNEKLKHMPYIVVIIDELADLMLVAAKEVEDSIMRITQMARAAGIHLIVATQRPSTDVITGVVKANIPSRISFEVSSGIDSRTILDSVGAEKLLGKGDMLYLPQGESVPVRIQGTFISEEETKKIVEFVCKQQKANYDESLTISNEDRNATSMVGKQDEYEEPLYNEIVEFIVEQGKASTSLIQRRFRLGYNRAARCIDLLEDRGIVGPANGSKPREVLVKVDKKEDKK